VLLTDDFIEGGRPHPYRQWRDRGDRGRSTVPGRQVEEAVGHNLRLAIIPAGLGAATRTAQIAEAVGGGGVTGALVKAIVGAVMKGRKG
jgi:hypothetical protein